MTVGELIRERRMAQSLSLGQLATKLGVAAAAVRQWERNEELPPESLRSDLGSVLDLDPAELGPVVDDRALPVTTNEAAVPVDVLTETAPSVSVAVVEATAPPAMDALDMGDAAAAAPLPPIIEHAGDSSEVTITGPRDVFAPEAEVEDIFTTDNGEAPAGVVTAAPVPQAQPAFVLVEHVPYWRDPSQRWRYWLRWVLLTVALAALGYALVWAIRELIDALGPVLDTIEFETDGDVDPGTGVDGTVDDAGTIDG